MLCPVPQLDAALRSPPSPSPSPSPPAAEVKCSCRVVLLLRTPDGSAQSKPIIIIIIIIKPVQCLSHHPASRAQRPGAAAPLLSPLSRSPCRRGTLAQQTHLWLCRMVQKPQLCHHKRRSEGRGAPSQGQRMAWGAGGSLPGHKPRPLPRETLRSGFAADEES